MRKTIAAHLGEELVNTGGTGLETPALYAAMSAAEAHRERAGIAMSCSDAADALRLAAAIEVDVVRIMCGRWEAGQEFGDIFGDITDSPSLSYTDGRQPQGSPRRRSLRDS